MSDFVEDNRIDCNNVLRFAGDAWYTVPKGSLVPKIGDKASKYWKYSGAVFGMFRCERQVSRAKSTV